MAKATPQRRPPPTQLESFDGFLATLAANVAEMIPLRVRIDEKTYRSDRGGHRNDVMFDQNAAIERTKQEAAKSRDFHHRSFMGNRWPNNSSVPDGSQGEQIFRC